MSSAMPFSDEPEAEEKKGQPCSDLTPLRAHYLKKSLIQLQFSNELHVLATTDVPGLSNLSLLGPPFSQIPKQVASSLPPGLDLPFLKYIFRQFVLTFPFMAAAPKNFYAEKVQPFVDAMVSRNIANISSVLDEDGSKETATKKKLIAKIERNMALFVGSATKLVEQEEVVRLTQQDLDRLERMAEKRQKRLAKNKDYFEVNIVGVRTVVDKKRMRSRAHEEFIIRTRRARYHDVYVSRRYGDFRTLANELAKRYPEENIRPPPAKDRTYVTAPTSPQQSSSSYTEQLYDAAAGSFNSAASYLSGGDYELPPPPTPPSHPSKLAREKNRLTLRSYLHSLLRSYTIASSPVLKSFLLSGFIELSPAELEDARRREEADRVREDGRKRFAKEIAVRVDSLREAVKSVKGDIMGEDGLTNVFATIKTTPNIRDLPDNYQAVVEWARISLASTVFHTFVASDDASTTFSGLKRLHGLMPYMLMKGALKITNPVAMIRSILDLFLAQPFGGRSLLQRMFTSSLTEEVRMLEAEIEVVKDKIDDPLISDKIRQLVYAPREIQAAFKADAIEEKMNIVVVALRSAEEPVLSRAQMHRLAKAHRAHSQWEKEKRDRRISEGRELDDDSDDEEGPPNEDAWFIEDLKVLTSLYQQLKNKEQLIALIFEGFTAELLKDIITIFYSPLAEVYRAASIADSLSDFQNFINDLIKTVEQVEELSQTDPQRTVQAFINLVQRHEHSFYSFVHKVHSKGEGLFDSLMRWIELFLTVVREGLGAPMSLEFLLPHTGTKERNDILEEVDQVALYHYKLKILYEAKLRRRFGRASSKSGDDADAEDEAAQTLVDGVVGELDFGELAKGAAEDLAAEDTSDEGEEDDSETDDTETDSSNEYETSSEDTSEEPDPRHGRPSVDSSKDKPLPSVPHIHRGHHPRSPMDQTHLRSPSNTSVSSTPPSRQRPPPPPPPVGRQRSLSLRSMHSMTSLLGIKDKSKDAEAPPPLPPLPASVVNQPGGSSRQTSGRPSPTVSPSPRSPMFFPPALDQSASSTSTVTVQPRGGSYSSGSSGGGPSSSSPVSSRPSSSSSTSMRGAAVDGRPYSPSTMATPKPTLHIPSNLSGGAPPLPSPSIGIGALSPTKPGTPSPLAGSGNGGSTTLMDPGPSGAVSNGPGTADATPSTGAGTVPQKPRKKKQTVEPPDLKHIPQLLPVFVEMMRPSLVPRKRTMN